MFRLSTGTWFFRGGTAVNFGTDGDVPVPGDYDGDGSYDIAVFRPATGMWFVHDGPAVQWTEGDVPAH